VELTEHDILKAKEEKYYRLKREKWLSDVRSLNVTKQVSAEQYLKAFQNIFPLDETKEPHYAAIVKKLCYYFSMDRRFNEGDYSLLKGILLFGGVGVGKTTLMQVFQRNSAYSYRVISCREVESQFAQDGIEAIERFSKNYPIAVNSNPYGHQEIGYCFDDLGTENAVTKHFGNAKNVMADILLNRYDNKLTPQATHITTNLSLEEIEKFYGTRVLDRIAENFNILTFDTDAKSRR
jgi:DNA replication protein DnaC